MENPPGNSHRSPALKRLSIAAELAVVLAWVLLVLRYQYQAEWEQGLELRLDVLFVVAVAAVVVVRLVDRAGTRAAVLALLRVGVALLATAVAIVAAEYMLRFMYRDVRTAGSGGYIAAHRHGPPAVLNSLGYREREVPPKSAQRYRIAVIGDSFTFGNGLEPRDRVSDELQASLGDRYEVFNFGMPGNNMPEHRRVLADALRVSPDYVLLQLFVNDFETKRMQRPVYHPLLPGDTADKELAERSLLYSLLLSRWHGVQERIGAAESYPHFVARYLADPASRDSVASAEDLHGFFREARAAGVGVGAFMYPALDALPRRGDAYPFAFLHQRVRSICAEEGVRCLDLLDVFAKEPDARKLQVSPFDAHPSALANRHATGAVVLAFEDEWKPDRER